MRLIDGDALYEKACELEERALSYVGEISNDETKHDEWKTWFAILAERTAFKHDIFDSPTIDLRRKKGKWLDNFSNEDGERDGVRCSECKTHFYFGGQFMNYCPNCGCEMCQEGEQP